MSNNTLVLEKKRKLQCCQLSLKLLQLANKQSHDILIRDKTRAEERVDVGVESTWERGIGIQNRCPIEKKRVFRPIQSEPMLPVEFCTTSADLLQRNTELQGREQLTFISQRVGETMDSYRLPQITMKVQI
ncbi:hypothetical protein J6590_004352 [Homalodisca vitripennis]|nr:hypothetical protein J6590_004352 [Homalodisca vitripennis]